MAEDKKLVALHEVRMDGDSEGCVDCKGMREDFNAFLDKWQRPSERIGTPLNGCLMEMLISYIAGIWDLLEGPPQKLASKFVEAFVEAHAQRTGRSVQEVRAMVMIDSLVSLVEKAADKTRPAVGGGEAVVVQPDNGKVH